MSDLPLQGMWVDGWVFTDSGSHAHRDLAVLYPQMPDDKSWYWVALLAGGNTSITSKAQLVVRPNPNSFASAPLAPMQPNQDVQYIWGMRSSYPTLELSTAQAPAGFNALGGFFGEGTGRYGIAGGMSDYAFLGDAVMIPNSRADIGQCIWDDHGSGADDDGSVWLIGSPAFDGPGNWGCFMPQAGYDSPGGTYPMLDMSQIDFNF